MAQLDLHAALVVLFVLLAGLAAYAVRFAARGAARFARVDAAGSSPLLGKDVMQAAYWCLQPFGSALVRLGVSANGITGASLALGLAAGIVVSRGYFGLAAALVTVAALGDALDGLVARRTGTVSAGGALFDASVDRYQEFFFLAGVAIHYRADPLKLALVLAVLHGSFMVSYGSAKAEALPVKPPRGAMRRAERAVYLTGGALLSPLVAALSLRAGGPAWAGEVPVLLALGIVGLVANVSAVRRLRAMAREMNRIEAPSPASARASAPAPDSAQPRAT